VVAIVPPVTFLSTNVTIRAGADMVVRFQRWSHPAHLQTRVLCLNGFPGAAARAHWWLVERRVVGG